MRAYYEQDGITLYHGDCLDILPQLESESVDLLVTDPPYGMRWQSNHRKLAFPEIAGDESIELGAAGVREALRVLKVHRHVYVFGRFDFTGLSLADSVELIWDKGNQGMGDLAAPWGTEHEYIQFAVYEPSTWNRASGHGRLSARLRKGSVLNVPRLNATAIVRHPTEKPVRLLRELIESSSCIGDTVLDPFVGVGSTLIAAAIEGRKAIGIELDEAYCEEAAKRLSQGALPLTESA